MLYHLGYIEDYSRGDFNQVISDGFVTEDDIHRWANEAYIKYCTRLMMAYEGMFETTKYISFVANQEAYALPSNFSGDPHFLKTTLLERVISGGAQRIPLSYRDRKEEPVNTGGMGSGDSFLPTYRFRGNNIIIEPTPGFAETNALLMTYQGLPPRLKKGTAQAGAASTITLDADADPRDDYYNNARIYIVSGNGIGQIRTISDYVGSTKVATVSAAWTTQPTNASVYSTLPHEDFPENFLDLLPLYVAKKCFLKERSRGTARDYDLSTLKEMEADFYRYNDNRTTQRRYMQPWHLEL